MKNSPVICQWYVASLLSPVCAAVGQAIIHHYMDDVLVCTPNDDVLSHALDLTINALVAAGFELQEETVQRMPPWKYLRLEIGKRSTVPQKLAIRTKVSIRRSSGTSGRAHSLTSKRNLRSWSGILSPEGRKGHTTWSRGDVDTLACPPPRDQAILALSIIRRMFLNLISTTTRSPSINRVSTSPEEEGLELEEVLKGTPDEDGRNPDEEEHGLGYPTQHQ
ncbi:hypothetical protein DUI87_23792 [Hirundo rustica rustica]|uniref:ribonuclease H n=1 Tax=Hirundo rustica rustica TaxID=333673 RepID=A0A3M0JLG1_HIRRU|nr:hypothetical protein DUI87_23792 [Hirundo rustica rustica]